MSGHPLHGTNPLKKRLSVRVEMRAGCEQKLWKLQRARPGKSPEIHPRAGGAGPTWMATEEDARARADLFPGWELVRG